MKKFRSIVIAVLLAVLLLGIVSQAPLRAEPAEPGQVTSIWSVPTSLSDPSDMTDAENPDLAACPDGTVFVVWEQDERIWYRVFKPESGWGPAAPIYPDLNARGENPAIAATSDCTFYLVWSKPFLNGDNIVYDVSEGDQFRLPFHLVSNTPTSSNQPDIVVDSQDVPHVVWIDNGELYGGRKPTECLDFCMKGLIFSSPLNRKTTWTL